MELKELVEYASDQERKINQLIGYPGYFAKFEDHGDVPSWPKFRDFLWGNVRALAPLETREELETQRVEVEEDDETAPSTRPIVEIPAILAKLLYLESSHILVRSEYEEAEQAALVANEAGVAAFLVGGQSGIGPPLSSRIVCET